MKINQILPQDNEYLQILTNIAKIPNKLYYAGSLPTERRLSVAVVGTRKPSSYGREVTLMLAGELAQRGVIIISGLAHGVDGLAHRAALDAGGTTIAVLGNGLPDIYPATHNELAKRIISSGGAVMSEYPASTPGYPSNFLARNRIVSGLADAIIVTEASRRSGTLNTAMHALEQGKEVFVVPGNITSPLSAGCNALLRQGATPVTRTEDVLEVIAPDLLQPQTSLALGANAAEVSILTIIKRGVRDGEQIQQQSGLSAQEFSTHLTLLEIKGTLRNLGANQWTIK